MHKVVVLEVVTVMVSLEAQPRVPTIGTAGQPYFGSYPELYG